MNKQFEEWLNDHEKYRNWLLDHRITIKNFERIVPLSMQWGVYLEFFDNVGIELILTKDMDGIEWYVCNGIDIITSDHASITEVQKEAIKKAFEILEQ